MSGQNDTQSEMKTRPFDEVVPSMCRYGSHLHACPMMENYRKGNGYIFLCQMRPMDVVPQRSNLSFPQQKVYKTLKVNSVSGLCFASQLYSAHSHLRLTNCVLLHLESFFYLWLPKKWWDLLKYLPKKLHNLRIRVSPISAKQR